MTGRMDLSSPDHGENLPATQLGQRLTVTLLADGDGTTTFVGTDYQASPAMAARCCSVIPSSHGRNGFLPGPARHGAPPACRTPRAGEP